MRVLRAAAPLGDGRSVARSLAAVAEGAEIVLTMLPDGAIVSAVALGRAGEANSDCLVDGVQVGALLVDMSSSAPAATRELGERLAERNVRLVDAPVTGGVFGAKNGTLLVIAGGERSAIELAEPLFHALGDKLIVAGPLGAGHAAKALNNLLFANALVASTEALLVAKRFGLDPVVVNEVFNSSPGGSWSTANIFPNLIFRGEYDANFTLELALKDVTQAVDIARATGTAVPLATACRELVALASAALPDDAKYLDLVAWLEELASTTLAPGAPTDA